MKEEISDQRVEEFLDSLWHPEPSLAQRVVAAYFIRTHDKVIEDFIRRRVALSGAAYSTVVWAKKTKKLLRKYRKGPRGYAYNPSLGTLETLYATPRTFRLSGGHRASLTIPSRNPSAVVAGYVVAACCILFLLWMGYVLKNALEEAGEFLARPIPKIFTELRPE